MSKGRMLSVQRGRLSSGGDTVARDLGWFSVGLGLAQMLGPRTVAGMVGMRRSAPVMPLCGLREFGVGLGILLSADPTPWIWGRVGGDVLDLATLGVGTVGRRHRGRAMLAFLAVAGVTALDVLCAQSLSARQTRRRGPRFDYSDRRGMRGPAEEGAARDVAPARAMRPEVGA